MTIRSLIEAIPRVPGNLPLFFDMIINDVIHIFHFGINEQTHLKEHQPRMHLTAVLEPSGRPLPFKAEMMAFIELIPLTNSVEFHLEVSYKGKGLFRLFTRFAEKTTIQALGDMIANSIDRILPLESMDYGKMLLGSAEK